MWGIKKHIKGTFHADDCLVLDKKYHVMRYKYKASAEFICSELNKAHSGRCTFYVVMVDDFEPRFEKMKEVRLIWKD